MTHRIDEPQWVLVNETLHALADFAHLPPSQRPAAICPVCREPVLLKLGSKRTHHYAHYTGATCATTNPETALHLNTKCYLATQLRNATALRIAIPCQNRCGASSRRPWLQQWDTVAIEYRMDSYRPDIALIRQGKVIGAIEVVVTHPVDEVKQAYFAQEAVEWIEVAGNARLYEAKVPWRAEDPLLIIEGRGSPPRWMCKRCQAAEAAAQRAAQKAQIALLAAQAQKAVAEEKAQAALLAAQEREAVAKEKAQAAQAQKAAAEETMLSVQGKPNRQEIQFVKLIDFYFPAGKKVREVYYILHHYHKHVVTQIVLTTANGEVIVHAGASQSKSTIKNGLFIYLQRHVKRYLEQAQPITHDASLGWQRWVDEVPFVATDTNRFPFRYVWDAAQQAWVDARPAQ
ncbi:competence protein CoiA family protein [Herpetosiphon gulosus]|uniref:Competence protein CoiA-like N-terminal domain-containing protein n=1 Tax=Herpetosiphon gulosus TaxID=1973496 RepID=A0ABP9X932_9CHLR